MAGSEQDQPLETLSNYKVQLVPIDFPSAITGDIYPRNVVLDIVERIRPNVEAGFLVGSLLIRSMMPNTLNKDLLDDLGDNEYEIIKQQNAINYLTYKATRVSHVVRSMDVEEDALYANIEILNTGAGHQLLKCRDNVKWAAVGEMMVDQGTVVHIDSIISIDAIIE